MTESKDIDREQLAKNIMEKFLPGALTENDAALCASAARLCKFEGGETISDCIDGSYVGLVTQGCVIVSSASAGTMLRIIPEGGVFGAASLFCGNSHMTKLTSDGVSAAAFIGADVLTPILSQNPNASLEYIRFLAKRVQYLNRKIEILTAGDAKSRLSFYLNEFSSAGEYEVKTNMSELASSLGLGRASLYRALDALTASGAIEHGGRNIRIIDAEKLRRSI